MRSIWKGHIRFSLVTIPVLVYNGVDNKGNLRFNQLYKKTGGRIKYKKFCKISGEEVKHGDIVKGYEYEPDTYVVMTEKDFDNIRLESNRIVDVNAFVDIGEIDPIRYEHVYYLAPNGDIALSTFALLRQALKKSGKVGLGRIILRDREDVVVLEAREQIIVMYKLRYHYELNTVDEVPNLKTEPDPDAAQLELADTLIQSLSKPFSEIDFTDRYREAMLSVIQDKIDGKEIVQVIEEEKEKPVIDIMDALKRSIEEAKEKK